jgi:hypothetical protein
MFFREIYWQRKCSIQNCLFLESVKSTPSYLITKIYTMKKVYSLLFATLLGAAANAQVSVTFNVDMNGQTVSPNGVHIAGSFADYNNDAVIDNPDYVNWTPNAIAMTDSDADGIYSITMNLVPAHYEYKIVNGNDWPFVEDVPSACQVEANGNDNRFLLVTEATTVNFAYGQCGPANTNVVRFRVDMGLVPDGVNPVGVYIAGDFNGWDPTATRLLDTFSPNLAADLVFEAIVNVGTATNVEYKFLNGNDFLFVENVPSECGVGPNSNRSAEVSSNAVVLPVASFNQCSTPALVTFKVNMSLQTVGANGVQLAGNFQGWNPGDPNYAMTDADGDNIYEITVPLGAGSYAFKFVNGNAWGSDESVPAACNVGNNRSLTIASGTTEFTYEACYNQCTEDCVVDPNPANITFRVNMSAETVSPDGVFMIGGFTNPAWQGGATEMTDVDGDGIYECTVLASGPGEIQYKFVNGNVSNSANEENAGLEDCGIANGIGGFNRTHIRSGVDEVLPIATFNSCIVNINEMDVVNALNVFPNPAVDMVNIRFVSTSTEALNFRVVNNLGQVVSTTTLARPVAGDNLLQLPVNNLASGVYSLVINNANSARTVLISVR